MSGVHREHRARIAFDPAELKYDFGPSHPMQPRRLVALLDLLETSGLWQQSNPHTLLPFRPATFAELVMVHAPDYVEAVQKLSEPEEMMTSGKERAEREYLALKYGFAEGDTPAVVGMHEVSALIAGGTLAAMCAVMGLPDGGPFAAEEERPLHVFHMAGGWHHAWQERASGFCIYNDAAVGIAKVLQASEAKVLYIDFDAHHGDGVQKLFYDDPRVMTVSIHETGRYLFPGTGDVLELGRGLGRGYAVNVPLEPFTENDSYNEIISSLLAPLLVSFCPDIIVSEHGCDTHAWDPLTHLALTTKSIQAQMKCTHELAHRYSQGRWVALGGGGYDLYRVVPRAWSILWAEMSEQALPAELPSPWVERWRPVWMEVEKQEMEAQQVMGKVSPTAFPTLFLDRPQDFLPQPRRWEISRVNRQTVHLVRQLTVRPSVRLAFPVPRHLSPTADLYDLLHLRSSDTPSRTETLQTEKGPILLRDFCPPSLVERMRPDPGLHAFASRPEREHDLLVNIASQPDCALALAHTPEGVIIGQVTIAPGDEWWEGLENVFEVAIEVAYAWREHHIARDLLSFALHLDALEDMILFILGLSWHWDTDGTHLGAGRYREMIAHLFGHHGFKQYATDEPNIRMEPENLFMARIGKRVDPLVVNRFMSHLRTQPHLSGTL